MCEVVGAAIWGATIGAYLIAGAHGLYCSDSYQNWLAEQEAKREQAQVVYTFGDPDALLSADASDAPEIADCAD